MSNNDKKSKNFLIDDTFRAVLLEKIDTLIKLVSYLNGVYNVQAEICFAQLSLYFLKKQDLTKLYFMDTLIDLINNKLSRLLSY